MNQLQTVTVPSETPIAWIGTGVMGRSMCEHLLKAGYPVYVYTRTAAKARDLIAQGAIACESVAEAVKSASVVITMVGMPSDVEQVYLSEQGILANAQPNSLLIDMTTTRPSLAQQIAEQALAKQLYSLDAPVSGGDIGARNASLSVMVGGDKAAFDAALPLFDIMGSHIQYQGEAGSGQHTKMCNQIVIASTMVGVCESLLYGYHAGLQLEDMLASIRGGAAGCWTLDNLAPRVLDNDFAPGFMVEHFIKDMGIALDEAKRMGIALPGLALAEQLYIVTQAKGYGHEGTHALMLALQDLAGD